MKELREKERKNEAEEEEEVKELMGGDPVTGDQ